MIKKLRNRFVRLSMILLSVVLIVTFLFITLVLFGRITESVRDTLKNYSSETYFSRQFALGVSDSEAENYAIDPASICVVGVNEVGTMIVLDDIGKGYMDADTLKTCVGLVLNSDFEFGQISHYRLFYYKTDLGFGYRIAFADSSRYFNYLRDVAVADAIIFFVAFPVLYILLRNLAKIFVRPVQKAWEQQQNFVADASHELKTPLTVILANSDILLTHPDETVSEQEKWVRSTKEEATHMKDMVNKMLFLAQNENLKPQKITGCVNLSELATRLLLQFEPVAYEAGVELTSEIENGLILSADQTAVNQIIHILLDNAVKYAGLGGHASLTAAKKKNGVCLITRNTGAPIPPEDLPHIFERFYRSDKARTSGSGYGLGLAICKSLAEQQNAKISVTSSAQEGTVFTVTFPKAKHE